MQTQNLRQPGYVFADSVAARIKRAYVANKINLYGSVRTQLQKVNHQNRVASGAYFCTTLASKSPALGTVHSVHKRAKLGVKWYECGVTKPSIHRMFFHVTLPASTE